MSRLDHLAHLLERHARGRVAQLRELRLEPLVRLLRQRAGVDERCDLAELHRRALHLAEHVEHALRRLQLALLGRGAALLLRARRGPRRGRHRSARPGRRPARRGARCAAGGRSGSNRRRGPSPDGNGRPSPRRITDRRIRRRNRVTLALHAGEMGSSRSRAAGRGRTGAARAELLAGRRRVRRRRPPALIHPARGRARHDPAAARLRQLRADAALRQARDRGRGSSTLVPRPVAAADGGAAGRLLAPGVGRGLDHAGSPRRRRARREPRRPRADSCSRSASPL